MTTRPHFVFSQICVFWPTLFACVGGMATMLAKPVHALPWDGLLGSGYASDMVELRPTKNWHAEQGQGVLPFTNLASEIAAIKAGLPCKWVSNGGEDAGDYGYVNKNPTGRYDFLCKGGSWATVSLMLDAAPGMTNGIGRVRLIWRELPEVEFAGQGQERAMAEKFLAFVVNRFVPAKLGGEVEKAFFKSSAKRWWSGKVLRINYTSESKNNYLVHRLEIVGLASQMMDVGQLLAPAQPVVMPAVVAPVIRPVVGPAEATGLTRGGLTSGEKDAGRPATTSQGVIKPELPVVTPTELAKEPDPLSMQTPTPPPVVTPALVPDADDVVNKQMAPSNFESYNKAQELTRDIEKKALIKPEDQQKIFAVQPETPVQNASGLAKDAPKVSPVSTPAVKEGEAAVPMTEQASPPDIREQPGRPLPQLKFIPKAQPVERPDQVIRFEDEGSSL